MTKLIIRCIIGILLLVSIAKAHAKELVANHRADMDKVVDKLMGMLVDKLFNQKLGALPFNYAYLAKRTPEKPGHLETPRKIHGIPCSRSVASYNLISSGTLTRRKKDCSDIQDDLHGPSGRSIHLRCRVIAQARARGPGQSSCAESEPGKPIDESKPEFPEKTKVEEAPLEQTSVETHEASSALAASMSWSKLPRLYFPSSTRHLCPGEEVALDEDSSHYLVNVMRLKIGSALRLFNEVDGEYLCRMLAPGRKKSPAVVAVGELIRDQAKPSSEPSSHLTLYFSIIKKQRLKVLLEKASEVGVTSLVPVITQNTQATITMDSSRRQLVESAEQSERMDVAELKDPLPLAHVLNAWTPIANGHRLFVCRERSAAKPLLLAVRENLARGESRVSLLVGPEGGFTDDEWRTLEATPFVDFVSLGSSVLRAETAGIVALGVTVAAIDEFAWK